MKINGQWPIHKQTFHIVVTTYAASNFDLSSKDFECVESAPYQIFCLPHIEVFLCGFEINQPDNNKEMNNNFI